MNLVQPLLQAAAAAPERPALIVPGRDGDRSLSFGQLEARSARIADGLAARGIAPGSRVLVLAPLSVDLYAGLIALWRLGAVAVFLDPWSGPGALGQAAARVDADALIAGRGVRLLRPFVGALRRIPLLLGVEGPGRATLAGLAAAGPVHHDLTQVERDHPALLTFSSGSGGPPKAVVRSHGVLRAQHEAIAAALPQRPGRVAFSAFPVLSLHQLAGGVTSVLAPWQAAVAHPAAAARLLRTLERTGCKEGAGPPALWRSLAEAALADGRTLGLERVVLGGAPVEARLLALLRRALPRAEILAVYGSTEAEPVALIRAEEVIARAERTARGAGLPLGRPAAGLALRIVDEAGRELPPGQAGAIQVAGPQVARGAAEPASTWHDMGDVGYRDEAGGLWLLGRAHALLRRSGRTVYPLAVEAALAELPFVERAALITMPFLEQGPEDEDRWVLAVTLPSDAPLPDDWREQLRRRGETLGAAGYEVAAVDRLPFDRRHRSRVDLARLRRRLIDRHQRRHLRAWLADRFPPLQHGLLIASYFGANAFVAQAALGRSPLALGWREGAGAVVLLALFFLLRIVDEHKDFASDRVVHPRRVLSRGLVTLGQLRVLGLAAAALALGLSAALGQAALAACLAALAMTGLIARDLFLPRFVEERPVLGALLHLLILPLFSLFVFSAVTGRPPTAAPAPMLAYAWVGYALALAYELARKTRSPAEERPGLVTYSRRMGPFRPAWLALAAVAAAAGCSAWAGSWLGLGGGYRGLVLALVALVGWGVLDFHRRTDARRAARLKGYTGLYIVLFDLLLAAALARAYGLELG